MENFHESYFYINKKLIFETLKNLFGEMKQFYNSKSLLRLSFLFVLLFSVITVVNSCKKDDDEEFQDHLVQFEVKTSAGGVIKTIVTQVGTSQNTMYNTLQTPLNSPWTSGEFFVNSSQAQLNLDANAELPDTDSELIINLWIDGSIVKTDKKVGKGTLVASIDYSFLEL
ncbi:hypothetical protein OK18_13350 [Chryseobacterium gallinarum]|uniref:Uncharacterized protein n=2 Tax=Chryseobacterium gallinarum TaxID=1324352 RepID=A0A0G3M3J4_CHRGL|nr:hypothetical protein OK18_13350 [Chryseobacterium gallinarum]QIY90722.1 hypothetical protein FOB44_08590 [Chryseobacterium gallinarum]